MVSIQTKMASSRRIQGTYRCLLGLMVTLYVYMFVRLNSTNSATFKNPALDQQLGSFEEPAHNGPVGSGDSKQVAAAGGETRPKKLRRGRDFVAELKPPKEHEVAATVEDDKLEDLSKLSDEDLRLVLEKKAKEIMHGGVHVRPLENRPKRKLQEKLDEYYFENREQYDQDLWELSDYIPQWMKDYFVWHRQQRANLTPNRWEEQRILVMQCLKEGDDKCGGTADRLKTFLFLLREAYMSHRLLLIHWTLPARLEEFLEPPMHGIDWRAPEWFSELLHDASLPNSRKVFKARMMKSIRNGTTPLFRTRLQSVTGGAEYYNEELHPGEPTFEEVYHDVWRVFFTPSLPVRARTEEHLSRWGLIPGEFAAAHLRALYTATDRSNEQATEWSQNALNCASKLRPEGPFLFASDHTFSTRAAEAYGASKGVKVVARRHDKQPIHLDQVENLAQLEPSLFYDTFIDLLLMGMSRCLTYNRGGFGQWGLLIGYNSTCMHHQRTSHLGIGAPCNWTNPVRQEAARKRPNVPFFLKAMPEEGHAAVIPRRLTSFSEQELPLWMVEYFDWHNRTKSALSETNWHETKYIVMSCLRTHGSCGGVSDRLKPLPFIVLQAARHRRLLLIQWQRPKPLEEFLVPPPGGLDWRVPEWLGKVFEGVERQVAHSIDDFGRQLYLKADKPVFSARLQTAGSGEELYANLPDSHSTYAEVFHGLFRTFFTPVPRLQTVIDQEMGKYNLVPGEYAAVHLRNMYGNRKWRDPHETISIAVHGVNCASKILPGAQVYFASDDKFAVDAARAYGEQRSLPVASLNMTNSPIHFDKDKEWFSRDASAYDDTFLDLYMLAQARCVAHSNGGYGSFGSLLSHNSTCQIRYFKRRSIAESCTWTDSTGQTKRLEPPSMEIPPELLHGEE